MDDLYSRRWDQIPDRGRSYLTTLALLQEGGRTVTTSEVAQALGAKITSWSKDVGRLRGDHGAVLVSRRGTVTISVPGWDQWIRDQHHRSPMIDEDTQYRVRQRRS